MVIKIGTKEGAPKKPTGQTGATSHSVSKFGADGEGKHEEEIDGNVRHLVALEGVVESIRGQRRKMEDSCTVIDYIEMIDPKLKNELEETMGCERSFSFYGVFDGHVGHRAAHILKQQLHTHLFKNDLFRKGWIEESITNSFFEVDKIILAEGKEGGWKDGACAVTAVVMDDNLYVGNAGDCECVLGRRRRKRPCIIPAQKDVYPTNQERDFPGWVDMAPFPSPGHDAITVSRAHKATDVEERQRVEDAGGMIVFGRMFGDLAVARAFGDSDYKLPRAAADYISVDPHVCQVPLDEHDEFIILASDGIWDKISPQEAVDMVSRYVEQKVRSGKPVAYAHPPPGTPLAMDAVQTPCDSHLNAGDELKPVEDEGCGDGKEEVVEKQLVKNKHSRFKMTSKLNQLSLEEIKSKKRHIGAQLINEALARGSKDNCTCVVVFFQWEEEALIKGEPLTKDE